MGLGCSVAADSTHGHSAPTLRDDAAACDCAAKNAHRCSTSEDSGVTMTTSRATVRSHGDRPEGGDQSESGKDAEEKDDEEADDEELALRELQREDGDGAVDEDQIPGDHVILVESFRAMDSLHRLSPYSNSTPPSSPPPARSTTPSAEAPVEIRVLVVSTGPCRLVPVHHVLGGFVAPGVAK